MRHPTYTLCNKTTCIAFPQVKKIARRQTQDGGKGKKEGSDGDGKTKVKSPSDKKDGDESESDSSFIGQAETNGS